MDRRPLPPGTSRPVHTVATAPKMANPTHTMRQSAPATSAAGPESMTPKLVPELMIAQVLLCLSCAISRVTASARGGVAKPGLVPASITPAPSVHGSDAWEMISIPIAEAAPPSTRGRRGPTIPDIQDAKTVATR